MHLIYIYIYEMHMVILNVVVFSLYSKIRFPLHNNV